MRKVLELNEKKLNLIPLGVILLSQPISLLFPSVLATN